MTEFQFEEEPKVKGVMTKNVITAKKEATIKELTQVMASKNIGSVIIVDDKGEPIGIVTERDIIKALGRGLGIDTKAEEIMSKPLITVNENTGVHDALQLMILKNIRHLVVVNDDNKMTGIASIRDLVKIV
ncbi:MAG: CBS domain-containing protein [Sulfolobaceae archaeon]|nr:CBS domain-containing protein [Sulfolobaceae archaeon]